MKTSLLFLTIGLTPSTQIKRLINRGNAFRLLYRTVLNVNGEIINRSDLFFCNGGFNRDSAV